ncbi:unnamed protein product [Periconia digitata]|uniref:Pyruvate decarboxylase n=1 Tax=Periconia digitata TaxID=1303443 RepID=A0A9W4XKR9_9PLEO|nr:unnamed protein product [Periconia digitata]
MIEEPPSQGPIDEVAVAEYLFKRLGQIGVRSIHGIPGDYNLVAIDYILKSGLSWVGNCNELNAGYAADGYARVNGVGALVTTFGVGELSALNAIAGSYSEYVPVVHIVGYPSRAAQKDRLLLHHTLGDGDYEVFSEMFKPISCAVSRLNDPEEAAALIDNAIRECICQSRPVYIGLPSDMVTKKINANQLKVSPDLSYPPNDPEKEEYVVDAVLECLRKARSPAILVDACAIRHRAVQETHEFISESGIPAFVSPMGKGAIDETLPNYGGVYAGSGSNKGVQECFESADLVISIGAIQSDLNTAGFTYRLPALKCIEFHSYGVKIRHSEHPGVRMNGVLAKLTRKLSSLNRASDFEKTAVQLNELQTTSQLDHPQTASRSPISQAWFWSRLGQWLKPNDIVITESGTSSFGIWETRFPKGVTAISQVLWGSIGYATGACQGATLAAQELGIRRTILFTGDGSLQLAVQELSTMIRNKLNPIIFVLCNDGYTTERLVHGMEATYNDVQEWRYKDLPLTFGGRQDEVLTYRVETEDDVEELFQDEEFGDVDTKKLRFVELVMLWDDAPKVLKKIVKSVERRNA